MRHAKSISLIAISALLVGAIAHAAVLGAGLTLRTLVGTGVTPIKVNDFDNTLGVGSKVIQGDNPFATANAIAYAGFRVARDDATHNTSGAGSVASLITIHQQTSALYDELPIVDVGAAGDTNDANIAD